MREGTQLAVLLGDAGFGDENRGAGQKTQFISANDKPISNARGKNSRGRRIRAVGTDNPQNA